MAKKHYEFIFSGVGGQGTVTCGQLLGAAASIYDNKFATMTSDYTAAARGEFAKSDVLIGEEFVAYFEALNPDVILVLHNRAYPRIKNRISEETIVVINTDDVTEYDKNLGKVYEFPISQMAYEIGSIQTSNVLAVAFIVKKTGIVKDESLIAAVKKQWPKEKAIELNMKAIEKGFELAKAN
jgi:2-oxoglutarate ferredoxin oxidoreductase subunit gamma